MDSAESNIVNTKQPLYDGIWSDNFYYSAFDYDPDVDDVVLSYDQ